MTRFALCFLLLFVRSLFTAQDFDSACSQQRLVLDMLVQNHYDPPEFTETTNREIIDLFVKEADDKNIFFMSREVEVLSRLAAQVAAPDLYCAAVSISYMIFRDRLEDLDSIAAALSGTPLILDGGDTINFVFHKKDRQYCQSLAELSKRIEKRIKYEVLQSITRKEGTGSQKAMPAETEIAKARDRSIRKFRQIYNSYHQPDLLVRHLSDCMSDAIARRCDPHSNFLNASSFGSYRTALSSEEKSFGFSAGENKSGDLVVTGLLPGGPAWLSDQIGENDVIAAVKFGEAEELTASDLSATELNQRLRETTREELEITVISKALDVRTVTLRRSTIHSTENNITGYFVKYGSRKMGFIPVPSFYLDPSRPHGGCADDVAREVIRLRADSAEGIILDLRYNGGGSMREAINLAGIFIDEGPVAIYRQRQENPFLLKDANRGTVWDGPLLILVNATSASASEFVTAALQDYNRAIVAGSESFGKGTAQNLLPLDSVPAEAVYSGKTNGVLKVTAGKFYRLSSLSLQGNGITPDVPIPGVMEKVIERESSHPYSLSSDTVSKTAAFAAHPPLPRAELIARSRSRLSVNLFAEISRLGDSLRKSAYLTEKIPLSLAAYSSYVGRNRSLHRRMESLFTAADPSITIRTSTSAKALFDLNPYMRRMNEKTLSSLSTDIVFQESVRIMSDMIELQNRQ